MRRTCGPRWTLEKATHPSALGREAVRSFDVQRFEELAPGPGSRHAQLVHQLSQTGVRWCD
jgi:hypothetical protein